VAGDFDQVPAAPAIETLRAQLDRAPELRRFAHEARVRDARVQLARQARRSDLDWSLGVRRLEISDDWALVAGLSIPLGTARRAQPEIDVAESERAAIAFEHAGEARALQATLTAAWSEWETAAAEARHIDQLLLPRLREAESSVQRAYQAGAATYLEWAALQNETFVARRERLDAALAACRAMIELQRLTGESFRFGTVSETRP
jgi:cobalt-zinc-cadmium efflux system outer membrane protein